MLRLALTMIEQYYRNRYEAMESYLRIIGFRHKRLEIPRDLYADWRDCLLDTLEAFHGKDWNEELERQWTEAINLAVETMLEGYELKVGTY
jgi:hemoglobin-like flavoprotein